MQNQEQLNAELIDASLANTPFHGQLHHLASIDSTNTHALEQAKLGAPHGSYYIADEQTAGRGRSDHTWISEAGEGLYLSVLLRPKISPSDLTWLPLLAGLAVHRAIREVTALEADLRWPNDILIGPRKVAGILVEAVTDSGQLSAAVLGIGINLHQQTFPADLATPATSLDLETGLYTCRQDLLVAILQELNAELQHLNRTEAIAAVPNRIAAISTWVQGRQVEVHGPQPCSGTTLGLDPSGFLRVQTKTGPITITTGGLRDPAT